MEEKDKKIKQIIISSIILIIVIIIDKIVEVPLIIRFVMYLIPYLLSGFDVLKEAIDEIKEGNIFSEDFLMSIATMGALLIGFLPNSKPEFIEAVFVMLFFQIGELFEIIAEGKSQKSINALLKIRPDYANIVVDNKQIKVDPNSVKIGDIIAVNPGEKIPIDGVIIDGRSSINTVAVTGESIPREVKNGDNVVSGCVNINGSIKIKVNKIFSESTASKIIDLVKNASENKSQHDKFITKFSKIYTPVVVIGALLLAIIPSIITGDVAIWILRALTFLVISCPCALVISVPLTYFGGIGACAKKGILIKGAKYLEDFAKTKTIIVDKTGTLTEGTFTVVAVHPKLYNEKELLHLAAHVEHYSTHPIAISLKDAYEKIDDIEDNCRIKDIEEIAGLGAKAKVNDTVIYVGNKKLMDMINIKEENCTKVGTIVHIATETQYLGHIVISDKIKEDSRYAIKSFKNHKIKTIMLTGDTKKIAENVANELQIDQYYAELMPKDKVDKVENILKNNDNKNEKIVFIGDGINDAPVIARCDIGIAMGAIGSDAAIEASDVVIMDDKISKINTAIKIAKTTQNIAMENIYMALIIKFSVLILATFGIAQMWLAVFADVGVTILAVLNAMRTLKV